MATEILHPMIFDGTKEQKLVEITGRLAPIVFKLGPLSETPGPLFGKKYADVTEKEGRILHRRAPELFKWPEGTQLGPQLPSRDEIDALTARVDFLYQLGQAYGYLDAEGKLTTIEVPGGGKDGEAAKPKAKRKTQPAEAPAEEAAKAEAPAEGEAAGTTPAAEE